VIAEDRALLESIEGHLKDISIALDDIGRSIAMAAEIYRFKVATEAGVDPLRGTDYEEGEEIEGEEE
jgi:hypothetical protein